MSSIETFKKCVVDTIPIERSYRLYVYDTLGSILFKDEWSYYKVFHGETKLWGGLTGYLKLIKELYPNQENHLINYIFTTMNDSLCNTDCPNSKYI